MVDPLPRWAKVFFALIAAGAVAGVAVWWFSGTDPQPAAWRVDPSAELSPASRSIPIIVNESGCASGQSADGRIEVDVKYDASEVRLDVGVRPRRGDQDCQSNPDTRYEVELSEPLGDREVVGGSWPDP